MNFRGPRSLNYAVSVTIGFDRNRVGGLRKNAAKRPKDNLRASWKIEIVYFCVYLCTLFVSIKCLCQGIAGERARARVRVYAHVYLDS